MDAQGQSLTRAASIFAIEPLLIRDYPVLETFAENMINSKHGILAVRIIRADEKVAAQALSNEENKVNAQGFRTYSAAVKVIPEDTRGISQLAKTLGVELPLINSLPVTNQRHIRHAVNLIERYQPKTIGIVGLTFKPGTDDLRESPSLRLTKVLRLFGYKIRYFDPNINTPRMKEQLARDHSHLTNSHCSEPDTLIMESDVVVMAHADDYAVEIALKAQKTKPVIDLNRLNEKVSKENNYEGICW
jgi:UDP-glucose 6-dehydrogenase